jgi:hypothetical protein
MLVVSNIGACTKGRVELQNKVRFKVATKMQKIAAYSYLFLVALYFLLASAHLINVLLNMVDGSIGPYFEFINASTDRLVVYALGFATVLPATLKYRKILLVLALASFPASYAASLQAVDIFPVLVSFFALTWFLTNPQPFSTVRRKKAVSLVATYSISILIIIEVSTLFCWFIFPFNPELSQTGAGKYIVDLETKTFPLSGSLAPVFAVILLFSWITKPFLSRDNSLKRFVKLFTQSNNGPDNAHPRKHFSLLLLACPIILSFLVVLYPYVPRLNVDMHPVGVDFPFYKGWLANSTNEGFFSVVAGSFFKYSDRPLSLVALYLARYASGLTASTAVQIFR